LKYLSAIVAITLAAFTTSAATAADGDFNKPGIVVEADSETFGLSLGTGATTDFSDEAQVLDLHLNNLPVTLGVKAVDDGTNRDYRIYVSKTFQMPVGAYGVAYVTPELNTTDGDSFTKRELRFAPTVGYAHTMGTLTPFVEAQYNWKSQQGDYTNFTKADSSTAIGIKMPVGHSILTAAIVDERDASWNKTDREAVVKMSFRF
jgi:hypothetical protein